MSDRQVYTIRKFLSVNKKCERDFMDTMQLTEFSTLPKLT